VHAVVDVEGDAGDGAEEGREQAGRGRAHVVRIEVLLEGRVRAAVVDANLQGGGM